VNHNQIAENSAASSNQTDAPNGNVADGITVPASPAMPREPSPEPPPSRPKHSRRTEKMACVPYPTPGNVYLCHTKSLVEAVIVLPMRLDKTYPDLGLTEELDYSDMVDRFPKCCYDASAKGGGIRWRPGYEDGGALVEERQFPVVTIGGRFPAHREVLWKGARGLQVLETESAALLAPSIRHIVTAWVEQRELQKRRARTGAANEIIEVADSDGGKYRQGPSIPLYFSVASLIGQGEP
jgi:hypothetical protein